MGGTELKVLLFLNISNFCLNTLLYDATGIPPIQKSALGISLGTCCRIPTCLLHAVGENMMVNLMYFFILLYIMEHLQLLLIFTKVGRAKPVTLRGCSGSELCDSF